VCSAKDHVEPDTFTLTASALCCSTDLFTGCQSLTQTSGQSANPSVSVTCPSGSLATGGGCIVNPQSG